MTDYIKRDALLEARELAICAYENAGIFNADAIRNHLKLLLDAVVDTPAADVAEVVHAKWENGNPICPVCGENKFKDLDADIWCDWQPDFCPNCGAKMDGGNDDG